MINTIFCNDFFQMPLPVFLFRQRQKNGIAKTGLEMP